MKIRFLVIVLVSLTQLKTVDANPRRMAELIDILKRPDVKKRIDSETIQEKSDFGSKKIEFSGISLSDEVSKTPIFVYYNLVFKFRETKLYTTADNGSKNYLIEKGIGKGIVGSTGSIEEEVIEKLCRVPVTVKLVAGLLAVSDLSSGRSIINEIQMGAFKCEDIRDHSRDSVDDLKGELRRIDAQNIMIQDPAYIFGSKHLPLSDNQFSAKWACEKKKFKRALRWTFKASGAMAVSHDASGEIDRISREPQVISILYCTND